MGLSYVGECVERTGDDADTPIASSAAAAMWSLDEPRSGGMREAPERWRVAPERRVTAAAPAPVPASPAAATGGATSGTTECIADGSW